MLASRDKVTSAVSATPTSWLTARLRGEGLLDRLRSPVMEKRAHEAQADQVIITDIAGVAGVDNKVADHLLQTTEAVRLLGDESILTGISQLVAKTIVRLGIDITAMHTRSRLAAGIELALEIVQRGPQARLAPQSTPKASEDTADRLLLANAVAWSVARG